MLAKLLATGIGLGSLSFYVAAFFFPEVHRRHDFFWSGVGLFYALVLWVCAGRFTGALLLGQMASVALVVWLGWQTLRLRRAKTPVLLQTPATADAWRGFWQELAHLFDSVANLTPLGRWLPSLEKQFSPETGDGSTDSPLRAAAVRKVGYEFVDDINVQEPLPRPSQQQSMAAGSFGLAQKSSSQRISTSAAPPRPLQTPKAASKASARKPAGILQTGMILKGWVVDVVKSMGSKPSRPVIEIPPREPNAKADKPTPQGAEPVPQGGESVPPEAIEAGDEANWSEDAAADLRGLGEPGAESAGDRPPPSQDQSVPD
ncbi:hypothetical protein C7271_26060 [filamentous cyanobacterium CCP5]|nr:hypothetical protein C7271_26060 [filamentous cyanobacterium CCP5]